MSATILRDHASMPWPNGAGITYEVVRFPETGDFDWRISLADIDSDCPFSVLEGIDRWIVLMEGDHMVLTNPDATHRIDEGAPFFYPGEIPFDCTLGGGPAKDLNIMTRRTKTKSHVEMITAGSHTIDASSGVHILIGMTGESTVDGDALNYRAAAVITGTVAVETTGTIAHIQLSDA